MKQLIPQGKSLKYYGLLSWVVPGVIAVIACSLIFVGFTSYSLHAEQKRLESSLIEKSVLAARRVSAELLLGDRGAPDAVLGLLREELDVSKMKVASGPQCDGAEYCFLQSGNSLSILRKIPALSETKYLNVELPAPALGAMFTIGTLIWAVLPILLMFLVGIVFQRYILRRYILHPVQALVETSKGDRDTREYWPEEIQNISRQLASSFLIRDQEVFAQIARGVIHDLRTLIHAPLASVELVDEVEDNPEKRMRRLESLKTICSQQLPKMREIIDHTLDGSRDISVRAIPSDIKDTIEGGLRTLEPLIQQAKANVSLECSVDDLIIAHDKTQLERAITNLVKNAIEACQEKSVERRNVRVLLSNAANNLVVKVEDSGPGLKVDPGKLFKPLKSTKAHGSGLGLLVTRKIIEAHGGTLSSGKSDHLGGAEFIVQLPTGGVT